MNYSNYSNKDYTLTTKECAFVHMMLKKNHCGAKTAGGLLQDNMSCHSMGSLEKFFPISSKRHIAGFLSSLQIKNVLLLEDDRLDGPDLYWVADMYLESIPQDMEF